MARPQPENAAKEHMMPRILFARSISKATKAG